MAARAPHFPVESCAATPIARPRPARQRLVMIVVAMNAAACVEVKAPGTGTAGRGGEPSDGGISRPDVIAQDAGRFPSIPDAGGACRNLQCRQTACPGGGDTTLTGTVYAPNGTLPLYNALVYVPNAAVPAFPPGLACDRCGALPAGEPLVAALTDAHGQFTLQKVPVGADLPLVIQVGKWRRQVRIPSIAACQSNAITDRDLTRLPRNRQEGDLPRIAVTTGTCDNLLCLLPKLGVDPAEWGVAGEGKPLTFYSGYDKAALFGPEYQIHFDAHLTQMTAASTLWGNLAELSQYDMAVLSCECDEHLENKGATAYDAVNRYLGMGGRIFSSDFQYVWYKYSPDPRVRATAVINPAANPLESNGTEVMLNTSLPKGKALADWYASLAPGSKYGEIASREVFNNFSSVVPPAGQIWGSSVPSQPTTSPNPTFFSMNTPVGAAVEQQCGRAVHVDAHIVDLRTLMLHEFPADCGDLSAGELVMAFFLFDAAACVQNDMQPPVPPPIVIY